MTSTPWAASHPAREPRLLQSVVQRVRSLPTWALLAGLVALSALVRFGLALTSVAPWLIPDELQQTELAQSLAGAHRYLVRDTPYSPSSIGYGPLYPLLVAPAYAVTETAAHALVLIRAINAVFFSCAGVPAYLLARRLLGRGNALLAAGLSLLVPSGIYAAKIMTESLAYPLFLAAMLAIVNALERPTWRRELIAAGAICLAILARAQMVALVPAAVAAVVLVAAGDARGAERGRLRAFLRSAGAFRVTWLASGLGAVGVGFLAITGHTYFVGRLHPLKAVSPFVYLVADLDLYSAVVPFGAFVLVLGTALGSQRAPRGLRVFAAASAAASVSLVLLASVYATLWTQYVFERYVFYVVPLFLIAFLWWIEQGMPRPRRRAVAVAVAVAVLPATLPLASIVNGRAWGTPTSTVALAPWFWVSVALGRHLLLKAAVTAFAAGLALAFLRTKRADAGKLVRITALTFTATTMFVVVGNWIVSDRALADAGTNRMGWIDGAVGHRGTVAVVWARERARERDEFAIWEAEFFNRTIGPVYVLRGRLSDELPTTRVHSSSGRLVDGRDSPIRADFVLTSGPVRLSGREIGRDPGSGLVLYRVEGEIRISP
jgi:hypothetical protein